MRLVLIASREEVVGGGRSRAKAQVAVRAVRRFRGLVEWMTRLVLATICGGGEMRTLVYHAGRRDGRTRSFRAVRAVEMEMQMQCRPQLCNCNERPLCCETGAQL